MQYIYINIGVKIASTAFRSGFIFYYEVCISTRAYTEQFVTLTPTCINRQ